MDYLQLPVSGLEPPLSEMEQMIQDSTHHFAATVIRPVGRELDRMPCDEVIAPRSPLWTVLEKAQGLGISLSALAELPTAMARWPRAVASTGARAASRASPATASWSTVARPPGCRAR